MAIALIVYVALIAIEAFWVAWAVKDFPVDDSKNKIVTWQQRQRNMMMLWCLAWVGYLAVGVPLLSSTTIVMTGIMGLGTSILVRLVLQMKFRL